MPNIAELRLWFREHDGEASATNVTQAAWFTESSLVASAHPQQSAIGIRPIPQRAAFIGVVMVPPELEERISLNGTPLWSGMHGLRHADRINLNGHEIWIAASASIEIAAYDPAVHGENVFCFLTKARLQPGEAIVRCPGFQGKTCNVIYKKDAWDMAMQASSNLRCPNCKFRPSGADWQPPQHPSKKGDINELLASITDGLA